MNVNNGKFTTPLLIYCFHSQARSHGSNHAFIYFSVNGSYKSDAHRDEDGEYAMITLSSQSMLNKRDTVWVIFNGYFSIPTNRRLTFFEGHLIRQINS